MLKYIFATSYQFLHCFKFTQVEVILPLHPVMCLVLINAMTVYKCAVWPILSNIIYIHVLYIYIYTILSNNIYIHGTKKR